MDFVENLEKYLSKEDIEKLLNAQQEKRTNSFIVNTKKCDVGLLSKYFKTLEPHPFIKNVFYYDKDVDECGKNFLFDNGCYYIMDASSLLVSHFLKLNENDYILDMCAAPGGKTISTILNSNCHVEVISNDLNHERSLTLAQNVERLGLDNVIVTNSNLESVYENYKNTFDKIILDAPCSGSSMFRKNELMKNDWTFEKVQKQANIQKRLLEIAFEMLKPGGVIAYSTCSFSYEENENVILNFIKNNEGSSLINLPTIEGEYRSKDLPEAIHLFPHLYRGEGLFICFIKKDENIISSSSSKRKKSKNKSTNYQKDFNLNYKYEELINDKVFCFNNELDLSKFYIIKKGLHLGTVSKNNFVPSFHLAHYLDNSESISLTEDDLKLYIHGDVINKNLPQKNGYYVVAFDGINLGYVKKVNCQLKNFYPKGLRHLI